MLYLFKLGNMGLYDYRPYVKKITNDRQIMFDCNKETLENWNNSDNKKITFDLVGLYDAFLISLDFLVYKSYNLKLTEFSFYSFLFKTQVF